MVACGTVARTRRVPFVDHFHHWAWAELRGIDVEGWTTDGCHPSPAGHRELAVLLTPHVRQLLARESDAREKLLTGGNVRVVCFGDSVTGVYYHTGSRRAYTDMLGVALSRIGPQSDVQMINAGISGNTTADGLARIDHMVST